VWVCVGVHEESQDDWNPNFSGSRGPAGPAKERSFKFVGSWVLLNALVIGFWNRDTLPVSERFDVLGR
tara:strand:- start:130 stop:333 length:204 start_codon:yes stop_codon:yes gene_type:complete